MHLQMGDAALAAEDFTRAIQLAPDAPVPFLNRAIAYETLGVRAAEGGDASGAVTLWQRALADCSRAVELDPAEFSAWFDRCVPMRSGCCLDPA